MSSAICRVSLTCSFFGLAGLRFVCYLLGPGKRLRTDTRGSAVEAERNFRELFHCIYSFSMDCVLGTSARAAQGDEFSLNEARSLTQIRTLIRLIVDPQDAGEYDTGCNPKDFCISRDARALGDEWVLDEIHHHYGPKATAEHERKPSC